MKKIKNFLIATAIMWLPILATYIVTVLDSIITMDMIMTALKIIAVISIIILIIIEKEERRLKKNGRVR